MNILVIIPKTFAGCGFYRLYQPFNHMAKNYDVKVTFASSLQKTEISAYTDEELKSFDVIVWHKTLFDIRDIRRAKSLGVPTVADFDDHWVVNREHTLYREYTKEGVTSRLHKLLLEVDYVTCTTEDLADEIYKHNENVEVLPNAYDKGYDGWKEGRIEEDNFIFGYLGGPCHTRDVSLLKGVREQADAHFRLFGYNGTDIYNHYANVLSGGGKNDKFTLYKGANIWQYPQFYNYMDVSLVPLEGNKFNSMKSELKMIEAGAFHKAVIVSGVKPYTNVIRDGKNCLVANSTADWVTHVKDLKNNPQKALDLGHQLAEDVKGYDINEVNKDRFNFLRYVQQDNNTDSGVKSSRMVSVE